MRMAVRKLRVEDVEKLQALVVENFDAIEPGLTVLDARLLLGHATIDVIGVDTVGALVLGAVGFTANEEMLLKAVEAYSWCLEYPEALVRLYPSCQVSEERPPRLLFVVERMPDAFHRKIKQLGFPEVDCVEFRHLEFDGVPTVYFESLLRLRRSAARSSEVVAPASAPSSVEKVITMTGPASRVASAKMPKPGGDSVVSGPRAAHTPVVSMVSRQATVPMARVDRPRSEPVVLREPEPLLAEPMIEPEIEAPVIEAMIEPVIEPVAEVSAAPEIEVLAVTPEVEMVPEPALSLEPIKEPEAPQPSVRPFTVDAVPSMAPAHVLTAAAQAPERVSFKDLADSLLGAMTATQEAIAHPAPDSSAKSSIVEPLVLESAVEVPAVTEPIVAAFTLELEKVAEPEPVVIPEQVIALAVESLDTKPALTLESAVTIPAPAAPELAAEPTKPAAPPMPQGFEGLKFPNDGVLTRQWMEFLSQMSTTK
jgi:hypothetical protein